MVKKLFTMVLDPALNEQLRIVAFEQRKSKAALIKAALKNELERLKDVNEA